MDRVISTALGAARLENRISILKSPQVRRRCDKELRQCHHMMKDFVVSAGDPLLCTTGLLEHAEKFAVHDDKCCWTDYRLGKPLLYPFPALKIV